MATGHAQGTHVVRRLHGLRSAPKIFTGVADAVEWITKQEGVDSVLHYLDDYLLVGCPESLECDRFVYMLTSLFSSLGLPIVVEKLEGPAVVLTFLGFEIDTRGHAAVATLYQTPRAPSPGQIMAGSQNLPQERVTVAVR